MGITAVIAFAVVVVSLSVGTWVDLPEVLFPKKLAPEAIKSDLSGVLAASKQKPKVPKQFPSPIPTIVPTLAPMVTPTITPSISPVPSLTPAPSPSLSAAARIFNLLNWKLTLPTGSSGSPTEIKQPALASFQIDPWFIMTAASLRFRAAVNGVTTSGSSYPRSELREMTQDGTVKAAWSTSQGTHVMFLDQAITSIPKIKPHVVAGQIHDAGDDIIVIRLEGSNLYVNVDGKNIYTLDSNYTLGKRFTVKFIADSDATKVYYNGSTGPVYTLNKSYSGAYFKAGAYTQSNCTKEGPENCNGSNFGEVFIYALEVAHT